MKLDQIAFYAHNPLQVEAIKMRLGLLDKKWVEDFVEGDVFDGDGKSKGVSRAHLHFNYDLGIEVEILTYLDGWHWHQEKVDFVLGLPFLSHIGFHMEPGEAVPEETGDVVLQTMNTKSHTNPYLLEKKRKYHYRICAGAFAPKTLVLAATLPLVGVDRKYIWRIEDENR